MRAMSLAMDEGESEQNEMRSLQEKLESTTRLVFTLSQQLSELKEQVSLGNQILTPFTLSEFLPALSLFLACSHIMESSFFSGTTGRCSNLYGLRSFVVSFDMVSSSLKEHCHRSFAVFSFIRC